MELISPPSELSLQELPTHLPLGSLVLEDLEPFDPLDRTAQMAIDVCSDDQRGQFLDGERFGRFVLQEKLGEGAAGVVFRAVDTVDGSFVAVKVLRTSIISEESRRRFVKESRMLMALDSPYVTRLIDADPNADRCYLAVEFVAGPTVSALIRRDGKIGERQALEMIADVARGVAAAHGLGIIHRDIKPENLLVSPADQFGRSIVKVSDFGLARPVVQSASLELTRAGLVMGTPIYMAPEQFQTGTIGPQADVYSIGATLYHMLAGKPPFPAKDLVTLAMAVAKELPPPLDRMATPISGATAALVARCLAKKPAERPADAGVVLREVERLLGGEASDMAAHPRLPIGSERVRVYSFVWELRSSLEQLWPHVSDTEQFNRAVGLPPVQYGYQSDPVLGNRRFASARVAGFRMEWQEHPFEWIEGRRMSILREFSRGPFRWFASIVELIPRADGGTTLRHTIRAEPLGLIGQLASRFEIGYKARRTLAKVYQQLDARLALPGAERVAESPFAAPNRLPRSRRHRLYKGVEHLEAAGANPDSAHALGLFLASTSPQNAARIRPLALARKLGIDGATMSDDCLRAVGVGLLTLHWDVICPICRIASKRRDTLAELGEHEHCLACAASFQVDLAAGVEMVFQVHPGIRPVETRTYCAGGPAHSPHVVAQVRLATDERFDLELRLSEGTYRLTGPQLPWSLEFRVTALATTNRWAVELTPTSRGKIPGLAPGGQVLELANRLGRDVMIRLERTADRDDALTAAKAMTSPIFRDLFPGELVSAENFAQASAITFLMIEIADIDLLFEQNTEVQAFRQIQAAFKVIEAQVKAVGGTIVKMVNDGLVATFSDTSAAVRVALGLADTLRSDLIANGLRLRLAVHRGLTMVTTTDERMVYFGKTMNFAGKLLKLAGEGELMFSNKIAENLDVIELLRGRKVRPVDALKAGSAFRLALWTD